MRHAREAGIQFLGEARGKTLGPHLRGNETHEIEASVICSSRLDSPGTKLQPPNRSPNMANVSFRNVRKSYGTVEVIFGVDVDVANGEFVVIVGPSGCGKSTLLRMVAGLEVITDGEIVIGGRVVNQLEPKDRDIAMVFQNYALYPHMSVFDNMAYGLKIRRFAKADIAERVRRAADILELGPLLDRRPRQLSGGQRQRVAMGRAIVREPAVFLFDEPLSNLDAKLRVQMRFEIQQLHRRLGTTSLYVTHDQVEAMTLAHRMIVMNAGRAEQIGTPMEVYQNPQTQFVAGFIGSPSMNFLPGRVEGPERVVLPSGCSVPIAARAVEAGRAVTVGVRPEHLHPTDAPDAIVAGSVEMVEQLGADVLVHVACDRTPVVARLPHGAAPGVGSVVKFTADPARVFLFDAADGARLQ
jgi:sn-glycerol 3-phosphate transport system ATP-binding protein